MLATDEWDLQFAAQQTTEAATAQAAADFEAAQEALYASRRDILSVDTSQPRPSVPGMAGYGFPGLTMWFAPEQEGKSLAELASIADCVEAGGVCWYVDFENGEERTKRRLGAITAGREYLGVPLFDYFDKESEHWEYHDGNEFFDALAQPRGVQAAINEAKCWNVNHIGIDSNQRGCAWAGVDENDKSSFAKFVHTYLDPFADAGIAVRVLDNVGWNADRTTGTRAKRSMFQVQYQVSGGANCSETKHGQIRLQCRRFRDGDEAPVIVFGAGDGKYTRLGPPDSTEARTLQEVLEKLEGEGFKSRNAFYLAAKTAGIKVQKQTFWGLVSAWIEDQDSGIEMTEDGRYEVANS